MKFQISIILIIIFLFFSGCSTQDENGATPVVEPVATETNEVVTPTQTVTASETPMTTFVSPISPLATPTPKLATPIPLEALPTIEIPLPAEGVGVVYGRVIDNKGYPIANTTVRLGGVLWLEGQENQEGLVMSDRYRSPQSQTDEWGNFVITDITPDKYGIVVVAPYKDEALFVVDSAGDKLQIIDVQPGSVIKVEEIEITLE